MDIKNARIMKYTAIPNQLIKLAKRKYLLPIAKEIRITEDN